MIYPSRRRNIVCALVGLATGVAVLALSQTVREPSIGSAFSPRWWPEMIGTLIVVLSIVLLIRTLVSATTQEEPVTAPTHSGALRMLAVLAVIVAYGVLWYFFHFVAVTPVLLIAMVWLLGGRGWTALVLFPATVVAVLWGLFGLLLGVPL